MSGLLAEARTCDDSMEQIRGFLKVMCAKTHIFGGEHGRALWGIV